MHLLHCMVYQGLYTYCQLQHQQLYMPYVPQLQSNGRQLQSKHSMAGQRAYAAAPLYWSLLVALGEHTCTAAMQVAAAVVHKKTPTSNIAVATA
jgi:hypothetical protein